MIKYYTGIGSRQTPPKILLEMTKIAEINKKKGYRLRSGGAIGADQAFQAGCGGNADIFIPNPLLYPTDQWEYWKTLASEVCSSFGLKLNSMRSYTQFLIIRNMGQIVGRHGEEDSSMVYCWTPNGKLIGGTRYALRLAEMRNIPILNLWTPL